jgi:hypothetical protein
MSDITDIYIARYGEPRAGEKVFIVTRQQKDGWEGLDQETNEIVPEKPSGQQAAATAALTLKVHMHKGCTRDAQGTIPPSAPGDMPTSTLPTSAESVSFSSSEGEGRGEEAVTP